MPEQLPDLDTPLSPEEIRRRLDRAARRGDVPGLTSPRGSELFGIEELAGPFDYRLSAFASPGNGSTRITWALRMLPKVPVIVGVVIVLTIWPGVWLTDSMLRTYWPAYDFATWTWYIPLTVLPLPWSLAGMIRRSRTQARTTAGELIAAVRRELGAS